MIQILVMCYNSTSCIFNTLKSWENYADRFCILINGGKDHDYSQFDTTMKEIKKIKKDIVIYVRDFDDFSSSRNYLIEKVYDSKYTIIFIDDSYELVNFKMPTNFKNQAVKILHGGNYYLSTRIFNYKPIYLGLIHECVERNVSQVSEIVIRDRNYEEHIERRNGRAEFQLEILKTDKTPRGLYYIACATINLYKRGQRTREQAVNAIEKRLEIKDDSDQFHKCINFLDAL